MKSLSLILTVVFCSITQAEAAKAPFSLAQYLEQVKSQNPEARAEVLNIVANEARLREADIPYSPEFYAGFLRADDKKQTAQPIFTGTETAITQWRTGFRKQTNFGLGADLYFLTQRTIVSNASPLFLPVPDYQESSFNLQLTQSLWRNAFGEITRSDEAVTRAKSEADYLDSKFKLKTILLNAKNAYWAVVSYTQVVKLQEENVARAKKLRDYMTRRSKMKLFDDTDAMQAEASYQTRELELQSSLDDRASAVRNLNTLRGMNADEIQDLEDLPSREEMTAVSKTPEGGHMSREDFEMLRAQAKIAQATAQSRISQVKPQLDLTGNLSTNGRDGLAKTALERAETDHFPTWSIGLTFSVPLDFGLIRGLQHGLNAAKSAAQSMDEAAQFSELRAWDDLLKLRKEAQGRYDRSVSIENIQTHLVKREQQRLLNGRATTFEALNIEQNLALSQIQRVRSQLALLQIHNTLKTFEAK